MNVRIMKNHFARGVLMLLINAMVLMSQGDVFAASTTGVHAYRASGDVVHPRVHPRATRTKAQKTPGVSVVFLAEASNCCVCGASTGNCTSAPRDEFDKLVRNVAQSPFEALSSTPPHDPPRT